MPDCHSVENHERKASIACAVSLSCFEGVAIMVELGKKEAPKLLPSNPGITVAGKVDFSNAQRTWTEHFNLVALMASVLGELGHPTESEESWLVHADSGVVLLPRLVQLAPLEKGGVHTTT